MRRFSSFHSTRNSVAARFIPSLRATPTATDHNSSGMDVFPVRFCLQASKRAFASSRLMIGVLFRGMAFLSTGNPAAERPYQLSPAHFMHAYRKVTDRTVPQIRQSRWLRTRARASSTRKRLLPGASFQSASRPESGTSGQIQISGLRVPAKLNTEEPNFQLAHIISGTMPAMQLPEARSCLEHVLRRHVRRLRVRGRAATLRLSPALASHHRPMR